MFGGRFCLEQAVCRPGQRTVVAGNSKVARVCQNCATDFTTLTGNEATCELCVAGKYRSGSVCVACTCPTGVGNEYFVNCPTGTLQNTCQACFGGAVSASQCPLGQEPNLRCDGTQTADTWCVACPPSKQKPSGGDRWCELCPIGKYKPDASTSNCGACTNKLPLASSVAVYDAWPSAVRASNACPWSCVAGYYKPSSGTAACVACNATRGTYALAGTVGQCSACTNKPLNAYYQLPRGFDGRSNTCPW